MKETIKKKKRVLLCSITKSGTTTETIANFEVLYDTLKKTIKNEKEAKRSVVAITDEKSKLWHLAKQEGFAILTLPKKVGGRYSVFSPVGLFPLAAMGIDVAKLLKGAARMRERCLSKNILKNPAAISAALLFLHYKNGKNIHDTFLFANDLEGFGKWYRQLMGESIGKEHNRDQEKVHVGMTPTVSIGSTDLHSMAQLYWGGPQDKFTTLITLKRFNNAIKVPRMKQYDQLVQNIQSKSIPFIMHAIIEGVRSAYQDHKRPFCEIELPDKSEESVGQLLQLKMMEMMYLGKLLNLNPFDQPSVEAYKIVTRKILAG